MTGLRYFFSNFLNLVFLRIVSRVIPIIMSGYIIKYTGLHSFGKLEFAKILNYLFKLIIAYGFIYNIPRYFFQTNGPEDFKSKMPRIFGAIICIKLFLSVLSFVLLLFIFCLIPSLKRDSVVIFLFSTVCISINPSKKQYLFNRLSSFLQHGHPPSQQLKIFKIILQHMYMNVESCKMLHFLIL